MESSKLAFRTATRQILVGPSPLVVGTLSSLFANVAAAKYQGACDIVEVRLDHTPRPDDWRERCQRIQQLGWPVILTLRLRREGGNWSGADSSRYPMFAWALESLAAIDVELRSPLAAPLAELAGKRGKICIVSYHNFQSTPRLRRLQEIVRNAQRCASIVKISTRVHDQRDLDTLCQLLGNPWKRPLCVIGMAAKRKDIRVMLPRAGSCLAYGYLDKPIAPGQIPARQLMRKLGKATR